MKDIQIRDSGNDIILLHAYGQSTFNSSDILAYVSLENLMASDILADVPNREKSLTQLWEAAQSIANAQSDTDARANGGGIARK